MIWQNLYFLKLIINDIAVAAHDVLPVNSGSGNFLTMFSKFTTLASDASGKKNL